MSYKMRVRDCAVKGCPNSYSNLKIWKTSKCEKHGELHKDCPCLLPFYLFRCPVQLPKIWRLWTSAIDQHNLSPNKYCVVCSEHFLDGQPTAKNPIPQINLGPKREKIVRFTFSEVHEDHTYSNASLQYFTDARRDYTRPKRPPPLNPPIQGAPILSSSPPSLPSPPPHPPSVRSRPSPPPDSLAIETETDGLAHPVHDHNYAVFTADWDELDHSDHTYAFIITVKASESSVWGQYSVSPLAQACYSSGTPAAEDAFTEDQDLFYATVKQEVEDVEARRERESGSLVADQHFASEWERTTAGSHAVKQEAFPADEDVDPTDGDSCDPFTFVASGIKQEPSDPAADPCGSFQFVDVSNLMGDYQSSFDDMDRDLGGLDSLFLPS